jgi:acyl-CoA reductase-like NAD-dependent aldehyde dehydrogenase
MLRLETATCRAQFPKGNFRAWDPAVPFGGYKMNGSGRESGVEHMLGYLQTKAVWIETAGP